MSDYNFEPPRMPPMPDFSHIQKRQEQLAGRHDAKEIYDHLVCRVRSFQHNLGDDEEIGLQLANFGLAAQLHIRSIGFQNPNLIEFHGLDPDKNEVTLVQHISQLSFMLIAVKPFKDEPYRIGFK